MNLQELPNLNRDEYKPLYVQLSDAITTYINEKALEPGDPLPSENDLLQHYGVSRMTVRIAIQRLATEGLIQKIQGKGTFVAKPMLKGCVSGVQSLEESLSGQGIIVVNELLEASVEYPTNRYLKELGLSAGSQTYKIRRFKKIDNSPLCIEIRNFPLEIVDLFSKKELNESPAVKIMNSKPETAVHYVYNTVKATLLLDREAEVMGVPVGTPVLTQFATHCNSERKPIMSGRLTFLAERAEICFEFKKNGQHEKVIKVT
jgi:GntR family transcriptional regulator